MNTHRPDPLRCAALALLSLCCAAALIELNASTPWPPADPGAFADWWERHGTAAASITLLRVAGITLAGWGIFVGTAGLLAVLGPNGLLQGVWRRITPGSFREILAAGVVTVTLAAPTVAAAGTQSADDRVVLEDLGPQVEPSRFTPVLTDLGPLETDPPTAESSKMPAQATKTTRVPASDKTASRLVESSGDPHQSGSSAASRHWTVSEGDHLWKIATKTVLDQGYDAEPTTVDSYWRLLIETNREILNGNPDLIHPGTVLALPPVQPQSTTGPA
ncbi:MAG: LysM peptidoglycan-binding domain-containing protein [Acidimicrobiaceae bacterium]|nr:LysM peptidoglycan-binding domain-containing protein [Acidimicrobiaceae bacterium]